MHGWLLRARRGLVVPLHATGVYRMIVTLVTEEAVSKLCRQGQVDEAVEALGILVRKDSHVYIARNLFYTVLKECVAKKDLPLGRRVHALTVKTGCESDTFLCNHVLRMYASHARLQEAVDVFTVVVKPDAFTWSAIISAHTNHGEDKRAIELYHAMRRSSVKPDGHVFVAALQACARGADLKSGQLVHADVLASGIEPNLFVWNSLVDMYAKCGSLEDARELFAGLGKKDVVTWSAMIAGYAQQGMGQEALHLYRAMKVEGVVEPNCVTFLCLLQACAGVGALALEMGKQLHAHIGAQGLQGDVVLAGSVVNMYAKCGSLVDARRVFDGLDQKDVVTWSAMIAGYSQQGMGQEALRLYRAMQDEGMAAPSSVTYVSLLQACASVGISALEKGKELHGQIKESGLQADVLVANSLVHMYAKCGSLVDAQHVFDGLGEKTIVTWSSMIAGYSQHGMGQEALHLYSLMQEEGIMTPNSMTFVCLLQACAGLGPLAVEMGRQLHAQITERGFQADMFVANSLINMYGKCGRLEDAREVFDRLVQKDVVTWNAMIAGYSQQGMGQEALQLYMAMRREGIVGLDSVTFVCLLQACASAGTLGLETGTQLHAQIRECRLQADVVVGGSLVNMYAKCGSLEDARGVFDGLGQKHVVTWNTMIAGYSQRGMGQEALSLYSSMGEDGVVAPDSVTFVSLLQACASLGFEALEKGRHLHAQIREQGLEADVFVASSLINMYAKCGSVEDAQRVFDRLDEKNAVTWSAMIAGYSQLGMGQEAFRLYNAMQEESIEALDAVLFVCLLQACASSDTPSLEKGTQLHAQIREKGLQADVFVANSLINMYAKCGSLENAQDVFDGLVQRNIETWNAMIAGYSQQGMGQEALCLYNAMQEENKVAPNSVTFVCLLQACAMVGTSALGTGKQLHAQIRQRGLNADVFVASTLISMYAKCGSLQDARGVFEGLGQKNLVTWSAMIGAYSQQGMGQTALDLYRAMQEGGMTALDTVTFLSLLQACASVGTPALEMGMKLHAQITEQGLHADVFVANSLVDMYAKCGSLEHAHRVFNSLIQKDVVTWTAMIAGYCQQGLLQEALHLFRLMQEEGTLIPNSMTFVSLLQACARVGTLALGTGLELHAQIREQGLQADVFVASSLVDMYAKCGRLEDARLLFDRLGQKNVVTWSAMIAGYSQQGRGQDALDLYRAMQQEGLSAPNSVTFLCLLHACASVAALHLGRQLHAEIREQGLQTDVLVAGSLINMYGKCGSMVDAQQVFEALPERDIVVWNALVAGFTRQGESALVFDLVHRITEDGLSPDGFTFLSVLTVCSHTGLVNKGREYFEAMSRQHGVTPTADHYTCMVDLLGRAGQLHDALALVRTMPVLPTAAVWHTLLGACLKWSNLEVGSHAFDEAVKLDKKDAAAYVLMGNIYRGVHLWKQAQEIQARRVGIGARKLPGQSWWTDMDGLVHSFLVGDRKPRSTPGSLSSNGSE